MSAILNVQLLIATIHRITYSLFSQVKISTKDGFFMTRCQMCDKNELHMNNVSRLESRGQEEAGRTRRMSVLFTGSTGVKFLNALNKPPLKLSLSYQGLSTF